MSVLEKLSRLQRQISVPKERENSFGDFYYRSAEDIEAIVKPLCEKEKAVLITSYDLKELAGAVFIEATVTLYDLEATGSVFTKAFARMDESRSKMDSPQITGSAQSYAHKYALAALFALDSEKDSDAMPPKQVPNNYLSEFSSLAEKIVNTYPLVTKKDIKHQIEKSTGLVLAQIDSSQDAAKAIEALRQLARTLGAD